MRSPLSFLLAALLVAPAAEPDASTHAAWRWERSIVPNAASPASEQCAVLDADLFAGAAPGLRDVRLVQDGRELAYATDISRDDRRGPAATTPDVDRALYEVALVVPAKPSMWAAAPGNGETSSRQEHPPGWFYGQALLPAHVPVERIRLEPAAAATEFLSLRAAETGRLADAETLEATLTPEHSAVAFTVGANLQQAADVRLAVHGDATAVSSFVLEMRRREICYQPLSKSPVSLLFGNMKALPVHYAFGRSFQPKERPLLSSMGPIHQNPAFRNPGTPRTGMSMRAKLTAAILFCAGAFVLTLGLLHRVRR